MLNLIAPMGMGTQWVPVTHVGVGMGEFFTRERVWVIERAHFISMGVGMGYANPMGTHPLPSLVVRGLTTHFSSTLSSTAHFHDCKVGCKGSYCPFFIHIMDALSSLWIIELCNWPIGQL